MRLLWLLPLVLVGCTSVMPLGEGRFAVPETVEVRSPFGTNAGYVRLQNCAREASALPGLSQYDYVDCHTIHPWTVTQSQGQGGQVASGALTGLGFGLGNVFSGAGGVSSSSSSSSAVAPASGHGGHH